MAFVNGLKKVAAPKFVHGGYAMKLFRESQTMKKAITTPKTVTNVAKQVTSVATGKPAQTALSPTATDALRNVTKRPAKYGDM